MPEDTSAIKTKVALWYGEKETEKIENGSYIQSRFSGAQVKIFPERDHGDMVMGHREEYISEIKKFINRDFGT